MIKKFFNLSIVVMILFVCGCGFGLVALKHKSTAHKPVGDLSKKIDKTTITRLLSTNFPEDLKIDTQRCDKNNNLKSYKKTGRAKTENISILPGGIAYFKFRIINSSNQIIYLDKMLIILYDPMDNKYYPLDKNTLIREKSKQRLCPSTKETIVPAIRRLKTITKHTKILPKSSFEGYLFFKPKDVKMLGEWQVKFYSVPIDMNGDGSIKIQDSFYFDFMITEK